MGLRKRQYLMRALFRLLTRLENISEQDIDEETPSSHTHQFLAHPSTSQDEEFSSGNGANQGGPPRGKKRKAEKSASIEKRIDQTFYFLKKFAAKPKAIKDDFLFFYFRRTRTPLKGNGLRCMQLLAVTSKDSAIAGEVDRNSAGEPPCHELIETRRKDESPKKMETVAEERFAANIGLSETKTMLKSDDQTNISKNEGASKEE
ncbi:hypothetical protein HNY73_007303 [Argiope bruennichi]|uniref:Uncharacterized protein n=1 Tax=Argiope bruennichi TaxID=94029 RepID=A0A8T0FG56_ARGBR|nr:hypothetical protein HNY73_007303 [Argiope bruennichi]